MWCDSGLPAPNPGASPPPPLHPAKKTLPPWALRGGGSQTERQEGSSAALRWDKRLSSCSRSSPLSYCPHKGSRRPECVGGQPPRIRQPGTINQTPLLPTAPQRCPVVHTNTPAERKLAKTPIKPLRTSPGAHGHQTRPAGGQKSNHVCFYADRYFSAAPSHQRERVEGDRRHPGRNRRQTSKSACNTPEFSRIFTQGRRELAELPPLQRVQAWTGE